MGTQPLPPMGHSPQFSAKRLHGDATSYRGRPRPRRHCVRWGPSSPKKGAHEPPSFWPMSIVAKGSLTSATAEYLFIYHVHFAIPSNLWYLKIRMPELSVALLYDDKFSHFNITLTCDGQTNRHFSIAYCVSIVLHGKNFATFDLFSLNLVQLFSNNWPIILSNFTMKVLPIKNTHNES